MSYKFSERSLERMKGVHPDLIAIFMESIKDSPIDFGIPQFGGVRTTVEQRKLFNKGKSKADGLHNESRHQVKSDGYGYALDFYAYVNGGASWEKHHLSMVAGVIMNTTNRLKKEGKITHGVYWGGQFGSADFNGWDMPHIELI